MTKPPAVPTALLMCLGPDHESVVGDLLEEYRAGRSRSWYWREALAAILAVSMRAIGAHRWLTVRAVITGWGALLLTFTALGDRAAGGLAVLLWDWDRQAAYATGVWAPFHITAALVSYCGFAMSAWVVARLHRQHALPMLFAFTVSVLLVLMSFASHLEWRAAPLAVPHPLFYILSVSLPYQWRSGFVLVPLVILLAGAAGARTRNSQLPTSNSQGPAEAGPHEVC